MPIQSLTPPKTTRKSKYNYTASDAEAALNMLDDGATPGDGPFESSGMARSAANAMILALGEDGEEIGSRVWEQSEEEGGGWYFSLKVGRKQYAPRESKK